MGDTQLGAAERSAAVEALLWLQAPEAPPILTPGAVLKCASEGACGGPNRFWPGSGRDQVSSTRFHLMGGGAGPMFEAGAYLEVREHDDGGRWGAGPMFEAHM